MEINGAHVRRLRPRQGAYAAQAGIDVWTSHGPTLPNLWYVWALAIDPLTPTTVYAGTEAGVFDIEQVAACIGDCHDSGSVTVNDVITLVNIALGNADASACVLGIPSGTTVDIALLIQAVNNALGHCQPPPSSLCGDRVTEPGEDCDDGGICIGGTNAGTACTSEGDCMGAGVCIGGEHPDVSCAGGVDCPGGTCLHCVPQGGDGCAANCTRESDVAFNLVPGVVQDLEIAPGTSGAVTHGEILMVPLPFRGTQTLTIGEERDGRIPVVIRADAVHLERVPFGSGNGCFCPRAVAAKTCGGTMFEPDGVTRSPDYTPGFTAGDAVCAGKNPCTFVHGDGNSASGAIACDGLDGVNVSLTQDSGGSSGNSRPPQLTLSGRGTPGSAMLSASTAIGGGFCVPHIGCPGPPSCTGQDASVYGADGEFCSDDDPQARRGTPVTALLTTGAASGEVFNPNETDEDTIGPLAVTGHPFNCSVLVAGSAAGGALASVSVELVQPVVGDAVTTSLLVAATQ